MGKKKSVIIPKSEIMLKDDEILMASILAEDFDEHVKKLNPTETKPRVFYELFQDGKFCPDKITFEIIGGYLAYMRDRRNSESRFYLFEPLKCESGRMVLGVPSEIRISGIVETLLHKENVHKSISENILYIGNLIYLRGIVESKDDIRNTMHLVGYNKDLEDGIYDIIRKLYGRVNNAVITDLEQVAEFWKVAEFAGLSGRK